MIDLHTHTLLSDGELLPSEMVRRAHVAGYTAIALTDHVGTSNIDFVLPRLVRVSKQLNKYWDILVLPGVEITHAPLEQLKPLVRYARKHRAKVVIGHGETVSEPVIPGTNRAAIEAGVDILAHPGLISRDDIKLAVRKKVLLEITTRKSHRRPNKRLVRLGLPLGAKFVLDTDSHSEKDFVSDKKARSFLKGLGLGKSQVSKILGNSADFIKKCA
ncbi:MAG: histidinol phosphate phosphatase domain-containing protein [Candidatus Omnitrophota bacterium]